MAGAKKKSKSKPKPVQRRIVRIPAAYMDGIEPASSLFSPLYQFENGLRILLNDFLTTCYGPTWWDVSLKAKLPTVHKYAEDRKAEKVSMPWIGTSARVSVLPIHLITLGQLEEIVKTYQADCIPHLFPSLTFFQGHLEVIKRVRNLYSHMFPCITQQDCKVARREISTLSDHINSRLP